MNNRVRAFTGAHGVRSPGVLAAFGAALLFGASTPLAKTLLANVGPWLLAGLLYLGSGIGLMAVGVWLHLTEHHSHMDTHEALEHEHEHVHDAHHQHEHDETMPALDANGKHTHAHRHEPLTHDHVHYPDAHHRHDHRLMPPNGTGL